MEKNHIFTSGLRVAINQIGKHGSNVAIAIVDIKIAAKILAINGSDINDM